MPVHGRQVVPHEGSCPPAPPPWQLPWRCEQLRIVVTRFDAPLLLQVRVASARAIGGLIISLDVRDTKLEGLAPCLPHLLQVNVDAVSSGDQV